MDETSHHIVWLREQRRTWKHPEKEKQMSDNVIYQPKQFNLSGLNGISDETIEMHFKLYEGYDAEQSADGKDFRIHPGRQYRPGRNAGLLGTNAPSRLRVQRNGLARVLFRQHETRRSR